MIWGTYYDLLFMFQVGIGMYIHKFPGFHTFHMGDFVHQQFVQKRPQVPPHCPWRPFGGGGSFGGASRSGEVLLLIVA